MSYILQLNIAKYVILTRLKVKGDFPDNVVIGGVPAKVIKRLDPPPPASADVGRQDHFPRASVP